MARIAIGRLDSMKTVDVEEGTSISSAMRTNGVRPADNEVIQDLEGTQYDGDEEVEHGKSYAVVQKLKSGC